MSLSSVRVEVPQVHLVAAKARRWLASSWRQMGRHVQLPVRGGRPEGKPCMPGVLLERSKTKNKENNLSACFNELGVHEESPALITV